LFGATNEPGHVGHVGVDQEIWDTMKHAVDVIRAEEDRRWWAGFAHLPPFARERCSVVRRVGNLLHSDQGVRAQMVSELVWPDDYS